MESSYKSCNVTYLYNLSYVNCKHVCSIKVKALVSMFALKALSALQRTTRAVQTNSGATMGAVSSARGSATMRTTVGTALMRSTVTTLRAFRASSPAPTIAASPWPRSVCVSLTFSLLTSLQLTFALTLNQVPECITSI